ncbi:hypothetical protein ACFXI8_23650 [Streptomyces niveus]|uniref:hypothetical protein n=1 Tax=Streptomyces niveus TaxID=193462 RepID=UPI0036898667
MAEWAVRELQNAGCTRDISGGYVTEEPKITDFSRGEEMTATAELVGFTAAQETEVRRLISE